MKTLLFLVPFLASVNLFAAEDCLQKCRTELYQCSYKNCQKLNGILLEAYKVLLKAVDKQLSRSAVREAQTETEKKMNEVRESGNSECIQAAQNCQQTCPR